MQIYIFLILSLCSVVAFSSIAKECKQASDCKPDECCCIGMERYSIPQCKKKGTKGAWCRPGAVAEERILFYPNEVIKEVQDVFTLFCPCDDKFTCVKNKCDIRTSLSYGHGK